MLALKQSAEKWPFSPWGSSDRSDPPPPGYGPVLLCGFNVTIKGLTVYLNVVTRSPQKVSVFILY